MGGGTNQIRRDDVEDDDIKMAGELFVRFVDPEDEENGKLVKHSSGHIVKKCDDNGYFIMLTARTNLQH